MTRPTLLGLVVVHLLAGPVSAKDTATELIQPAQSRVDLYLEVSRGSAVVTSGGTVQRVPLRQEEVLTTIAETAQGWAAAGHRQEETGMDLVVLRRDLGGTHRLPSPGAKRHEIRLRPALIVESSGRDLSAIAWLEGAHVGKLSVRTAVWDQDHWSEPEIVAPPGRGSQTGLVATELGDGRSLLVWAAFDGRDDDLLWSIGDGQRWRPPQRVAGDNREPDITPSLVATDRGAWLAWSRLVDGEYRVMVARFDGGAWSAPRAIGPAGSGDPSILLKDGRLHLIFKHAWPRGWVVAELTERGGLDRSAVAPLAAAGRPILLGSSGATLELLFPDGRRPRLDWEALP